MTTKLLDASAPAGFAISIDPSRLLTSPLAGSLLGVEVCGDFYARDGFRFVGTAASASHALLEAELQKFRALFKLNQAAAAKSYIRIGYDEHVRLRPDDIKESIAHLSNPRARIVHELFWPHVSEEMFGRLKQGRRLDCERTARELSEAAARADGLERAIFHHALAIIHHNLAIAHELAFAAGEADWSEQHWTSALSYWSDTLASEHFWDYLRGRIEAFDDPRLKPDDVALLRGQLPGILLGFHVIFARAYARAEAHAACTRHLDFINRCALAHEAKHEALTSAIRALLSTRLEPLERRVEAELLERAERLDRQEFRRICDPVLAEAQAARAYLTDALSLPEELARLAEFDRLSEKVLGALGGKLDYTKDDRARCLLYSSLVTKKMLGLPLSSSMRRRLEQSRQRDAEMLYSGLLPAGADLPDPSRCWFVEDEEPDPDASLIFPVYRVTSREVKVDYLTGSAGINVGFERRDVLVPRSAYAKAVHEGRLKLEEIPERRLDDQCKGMLKRISYLEGKVEEAARESADERDAAISQSEAHTSELVAEHERRTAVQLRAEQDELERVRREVDGLIEAERVRCDHSIAEAERRAQPQLARTRLAHDRVLEANRGLRGAPRLELPVFAAASVVLWTTAQALGLWHLASWLGSVPVQSALVIALCVVLSLVAGRMVRGRRVVAATRALAEPRHAFAAEVARLKRESTQRVAKFERRLKEAEDRLRSSADAAATERYLMVEDGRRRVEKIRREYDDEIEKLRRTTAAEVEPLRARVMAHVQGKPKSAEKQFPAYVGAKAAGFDDGTEPSSYEMQMTYAERQEALSRLRVFEGLRGRY
jgi:hypothetical protein